MAACEDWISGMQWNGVYRCGPMGRKLLGNCEKHFVAQASFEVPGGVIDNVNADDGSIRFWRERNQLEGR